tara:strand:+ start:178 stop:558 length:381 start_codon:yes stop_codon:yes gene_type:complete
MKSKKSSNRSFGILFFIVFLIIGLWPVLSSNEIRLWSIIISLIFLFLGLINSKILAPFNAGWVKFGEILGSIIAPIVMFVIFSIIVTPIGLSLKLFGKDLLKMKKNKITKTYWILRENVKSMKRQF